MQLKPLQPLRHERRKGVSCRRCKFCNTKEEKEEKVYAGVGVAVFAAQKEETVSDGDVVSFAAHKEETKRRRMQLKAKALQSLLRRKKIGRCIRMKPLQARRHKKQ